MGRDGNAALLRRAAAALPRLLPPLMAVHTGRWAATVAFNGLYVWIIYNAEGETAALVTMVFGAVCQVFLSMFFSLLFLGSFRFCLERSEGAPGQMPWTALGQWRQYKSWMLWHGAGTCLISFVRHICRRVFWQFFFNVGNWITLAENILFLLLFPFFAAVWTAYVRHPEEGYIKALVQGSIAGIKTLPRCIWYVLFADLIYVLMGLCNVWLSHLPFEWPLTVVRTALGWSINSYRIVMLAFLGAARYDAAPSTEEG